MRGPVTAELEAVFEDATTVIVRDCFHGYSARQAEKVILAVEVAQPDGYHSHVVKLGTREKVACDLEGWRACAQGRPFGHRIFAPVTGRELAEGRFAVVYEDAYQ